MTAAILMLPALAAAGLAIDYTNMLSVKFKLSDSLDAAAFVAANLYMQNASDHTIETEAGRIFSVNMGHNTGVAGSTFSYGGVSQNGGSKTIRVRATVTYDPVFMPVVWKLLSRSASQIRMARESEVSLSTTTVEVALVLDNSGSMYGSKIASLRKATRVLVDDLFTSARVKSVGPPVQVSIVPFAGSVNVGPSNRNAAWMDTRGLARYHHENFDWSTLDGATRQADGSWELNGTRLTRFWLYDRMHTAWDGCVEARPYPYNVDNAAPDPSDPDSLFVPMFAPDDPDTGGSAFYDNYLDDGIRVGPVSDRPDQGEDHRRAGLPSDRQRLRNMTKYAARPRPGLPGPNRSCTSEAILPMTSKKAQIEQKINRLRADGNTNVPEGIAWGLHTLSPGNPFDGPRDYGTRGNIKAIVVMTDGENSYMLLNNLNRSVYSAYGYVAAGHLYDGTTNAGDVVDAMNQQLLKVCAAAKARDVTLFTVAFGVRDGSSIKTMLEKCASTDAKTGARLYFDVRNNGSELEKAFSAIGAKISALRLTR